MVGPAEAGPYDSEVELRADLEHARYQDRRRGPPSHATRAVGEVLAEHGVGVGDVVEVEVDRRLRRAEAEDLRQSQIDLVQPLDEQLTRLLDLERLERDERSGPG